MLRIFDQRQPSPRLWKGEYEEDREQRKNETWEERLRGKKRKQHILYFIFMRNNLKINKIMAQKRYFFNVTPFEKNTQDYQKLILMLSFEGQLKLFSWKQTTSQACYLCNQKQHTPLKRVKTIQIYSEGRICLHFITTVFPSVTTLISSFIPHLVLQRHIIRLKKTKIRKWERGFQVFS